MICHTAQPRSLEARCVVVRNLAFNWLHQFYQSSKEKTSSRYPFISGQHKMPMKHTYEQKTTHTDTCTCNQSQSEVSSFAKTPPAIPHIFLHSWALWHITQQHQLPDTFYHHQLGSLLIQPLKKSFLSKEENVTLIQKKKKRVEGGGAMVKRSSKRTWQSEIPHWPQMHVLGSGPDHFFI